MTFKCHTTSQTGRSQQTTSTNKLLHVFKSQNARLQRATRVMCPYGVAGTGRWREWAAMWIATHQEVAEALKDEQRALVAGLWPSTFHWDVAVGDKPALETASTPPMSANNGVSQGTTVVLQGAPLPTVLSSTQLSAYVASWLYTFLFSVFLVTQITGDMVKSLAIQITDRCFLMCLLTHSSIHLLETEMVTEITTTLIVSLTGEMSF